MGAYSAQLPPGVGLIEGSPGAHLLLLVSQTCGLQRRKKKNMGGIGCIHTYTRWRSTDQTITTVNEHAPLYAPVRLRTKQLFPLRTKLPNCG